MNRDKALKYAGLILTALGTVLSYIGEKYETKANNAEIIAETKKEVLKELDK